MKKSLKSIAVVAPSRNLEKETAAQVEALSKDLFGAGAPSIVFHPQCFFEQGHFAGSDHQRTEAFLEVANDDGFDAVWFARGGYGACRLNEQAFSTLNNAARRKVYFGYSDAGVILGRLYAMGVGNCVHGPMPIDIVREDGAAAVARALSWMVDGDEKGLDVASKSQSPRAAFNITTLSHMVGTDYEPGLSGHVLALEDIAEYHYRIDRSLFTILSSAKMKNLKGVLLGRCSEIPDNDPPFLLDEEEIVRHWCDRAGIPYLGRADIGHDIDNKIVVFGA